MHIDFRVEGTLIVNDILDVGNIETSSGNISTHKDDTLILSLFLLSAKLDSLRLNLLHARSEPI